MHSDKSNFVLFLLLRNNILSPIEQVFPSTTPHEQELLVHENNVSVNMVGIFGSLVSIVDAIQNLTPEVSGF